MSNKRRLRRKKTDRIDCRSDVKTTIEDGVIHQIATEITAVSTDVIGRWVTDTRDAQFIEALKELGWTPPPAQVTITVEATGE